MDILSNVVGPRVAFETLGCKLNQAETDSMARQLADAGFVITSQVNEADVYVLNTCTVTHIADRKCRHLLRLAHRRNPGARLVVTGCYSQRAADELKKIEGVSLILANAEKDRLAELLAGLVNWEGGGPEPFHQGRTRAFIKIQDGCANFCSYCIVPHVRGPEKSIPLDEVLAEVKKREIEGVQEIVLTGTRVGSYHDGGNNLRILLEKLLAETRIPRLRLSSVQPQEVSPELLALWHDSRLCPHFHMSLQSGSDSVLRRMRRLYSLSAYLETVNMVRTVLPGVAISTDIIVGFPGETENEFNESYELCHNLGFSRIHVFPFSSRKGTDAAGMTPLVPEVIKRQREEKMLALSRESLRKFASGFLGIKLPVLWESRYRGIWPGFTGNYIKVYVRSEEELRNNIIPVTLAELVRDGVRGEIARGISPVSS